MNETTRKDLIRLFEGWIDDNVAEIVPLPQSGSDRKYFRMFGQRSRAIGVFNPDKKENLAFLSFTKTFLSEGLRVPEIYAEAPEDYVYLLRDLGDTTLYSYLKSVRSEGNFPQKLLDTYKSVIEELPRFQIAGGQNIDYSACYPRSRFDKQSMHWDLNYFKYYFLKLAKIPFDEQALEEDFQTFMDYLLGTDCDFFLYRDFQSRNVMLVDDQPYFIDYQGGRRGALQYDLASLLYDSKADIPQPIRDQLLKHYLKTLRNYRAVDTDQFVRYFHGYVLIRIMQAMGSYGYRGFYEKKEHFLQSIPYALENLRDLLGKIDFPVKLPTLIDVLGKLIGAPRLKTLYSPEKTMTVKITSFSYKKGIPIDTTGHGGGFVFDCRAIHNPGRYAEYKQLTGKDPAVQNFLEDQPEFHGFLQNVFALVDQSVETYLQRKFTHLMVNFGCTGGQHRSVYCAEKLAEHLRDKYKTNIELRHIELDTEE